MRLIFDEYEEFWVWVDDSDEREELSPPFDDEHDAVQWKARMKRILTGVDEGKEKR